MKAFIVLCSIISIVYCKTLGAHSGFHRGSERICINMWDEGCSNGQLGGAGNDDDYLNGGFNPGKRCVNMWDDGCVNGQLGGSGNDDNYLGGEFNPGKRCVNMWDDGCANGQLGGSGNDDDYLNGGFNPGKRSLQSLLQKLKHINHEQHH
ncbi:hypothetical protein PYW08_008800 [Mythimna loreyi]|uniref:Uncharacterized protein n=1 Tax=Mythimna loreyi TaxID=667449 RepID=A0ACC2Q9F6_9NEOP|nr:hypothetical protein PYW08_008800 [Mythimna loreyi]